MTRRSASHHARQGGAGTVMAAVTAAAMSLALAACSGGLQLPGSNADAMATGSAGAPRGQTAQAKNPPVDMGGRWVLASPEAGYCNMNFGGAVGAAEGTIAPEGGCPANFFTSRKWNFEQGGLVIRNHLGEPLAQLALTSPGRLEGKATSGASVSLTR